MSADIIAESQTQRTVDILLRGEADPKSQQVALASLLMAVTKQGEALAIQGEELKAIKNSLWTKSDMEAYIDARSVKHCTECPAKKYVDSLMSKPKKERPWYLELISSESIRSFILVLILIWTVVVTRTSTDQAATIFDKVQKTITGGLR